jgi:putative SOS response-associated peptidase YedK
MCGRYERRALREDIIKYFNIVDGLDYFDIHGYKANPEVFPGEWILAVNNENRPEEIWWTIEDNDNSGIYRRAINAKAETVTKVNMFSEAFRKDRILIPATGFFEWDASKQRHLFTFDQPLFAFGGIARDCEIKGETKRCGVILTTEANAIVRPIHTKGRMPVVIHKYDHAKWLDPYTPFTELRRMMLPLPSEQIRAARADEPQKADSLQGGLF